MIECGTGQLSMLLCSEVDVLPTHQRCASFRRIKRSTHMPDDGWRPQERMELVTFASVPGIPDEVAAPLLERGAPKAMLGLYRAADTLTLVENSASRQLVCFGSLAYQGRACLDPWTGAVVYLLDLRGGVRGGDEWVVVLVNSSLEQFIASVRAVLNRYPFDSPQAKHESDENFLDRNSAELGRAADDLRQALRAIDAAAIADPDRFWLDFTDDVYRGTYSTDDDS
jgi:hypothetical protein